MRLALVAIVLVLSAPLFGGAAAAQSPQVQFGPSAPNLEFGAHINFFELFTDSSRTYGGRFAKRHTDWLVSEVTYDRTTLKYEHRDTRLLIVSARLQSPVTGGGKRPFISLGVARAGGLSFDWSPVVAAGAQIEAPNGVLAFRAELQFFTRGRAQSGGALYTSEEIERWQHSPYERARLVMGIAVGIP